VNGDTGRESTGRGTDTAKDGVPVAAVRRAGAGARGAPVADASGRVRLAGGAGSAGAGDTDARNGPGGPRQGGGAGAEPAAGRDGEVARGADASPARDGQAQLREGKEEGVVVAEHEGAGRGRLGEASGLGREGEAPGAAEGPGAAGSPGAAAETGAADRVGGADAGAVDGTALTARRRAAWRASRRTLWRTSVDRPMAELLKELGEESAAVWDLDESPDIYGDGVVAGLERRVAELLGFPAAVHFPTGTMAQQVALRCWAGRTGNPVVALHPLAHPEVHERGALGSVGGLRTVHPVKAPRLPTADEIREFEEPFGTLMLELPLREAGFVLPEWDELTAVVEAARERDAVVHIDGARLWECTSHFGRTLPEIAGLGDSVYVSLYKSAGGFAGAVLAGPEELTAEARAWRHRYGGQAFHQFPLVLSALAGLERELPRLPSYVARAKVVAAALAEGFREGGTGWFGVRPEIPHTHQFHVWLPYPAEDLNTAGLRLAEETGVTLFRTWWEEGCPPGTAMTEVTVTAEGLEWTTEDVRRAVAGFLARLP
jgi:threonine aldolase